MKNFQMLLDLYMRVNGISRVEMAEQIGVPRNALRRIADGKEIKGSEAWIIVIWLFGKTPPVSG